VLLAVDDHHGLAVDVLLVARDAVVGHQRLDAVLARPDPRPASVDPRPVGAGLGECATTDPVAGLQQRHRVAGLFEPQRSRQAREPRARHTVINVSHNWHGLLPRPLWWGFVAFSR